jgi:hypothetical protein
MPRDEAALITAIACQKTGAPGLHDRRSAVEAHMDISGSRAAAAAVVVPAAAAGVVPGELS